MCACKNIIHKCLKKIKCTLCAIKWCVRKDVPSW